MKSIPLSILVFFLSLQMSFSQWEIINTGINDDFTGTVFLDNNGLLAGHNGLYYTSNYGIFMKTPCFHIVMLMMKIWLILVLFTLLV